MASTSDPNEPLGSQPTISQPSHTTNRALSPPRRSSFQSSFLQWFNAGGSHYIRSLRWAVPTVETAASRMRSATNFSARASQAKIAGALTPVGVPFNSPDGPSWGPGYTEWDVAIRLFNTPCECGIPHTPRSPGIFKRCVRCYGYSLTGILPKSACCTLCREPSSLVCVVCLQGFHVNSKCGLGTGANMVYCRQDLDGCHACPDCMWSWVNSLNMRANEIPSHQQIEVTSIMEKAHRHLRRLTIPLLPLSKTSSPNAWRPRGTLLFPSTVTTNWSVCPCQALPTKLSISLTQVIWRFVTAYAVGSVASTLYLLLWIQCS